MLRTNRPIQIHISPANLVASIALGIFLGGIGLGMAWHLYMAWQLKMIETSFTEQPPQTPPLLNRKTPQANPNCQAWTSIFNNEKDPQYKEAYRARMLKECP